MLFPTLDFLLFFSIVVGAMVLLRGRYQSKKLLLVVASYVFYAQWNWHFCLLLAFSSVVTFVAGRLLSVTTDPSTTGANLRRGEGHRRLFNVMAGLDPATHDLLPSPPKSAPIGPDLRKWIVAAAVTIHLGVLATFKYFDFFVGSANQLARALGLTHELPFIEIILPVGISFFTFHGISYVVDVYRGDVAVCRRLTDMLLYLSFFPQLVAGPIVRASFFLPQLYEAPKERLALGPPLMLILGGLFKKVVVANYLATDLVDPVFFDPASFGTLDLVLAAYAYAIQIYCDFSAYSDMAIGLAALLGYRFPPNFNQPYRAASLQEFWRRWHISLSSWLRDYLYKPLGGSRRGPLRTMANLIATMLLGGIWHGAAWKFVAWGAIHGTGLVAERLLQRTPGTWAASRAGRIVATVLVFHFVCLAWVFFRADSTDTVLIYLSTAARLVPGITQTSPFTLGLIILGFVMQFLPPDFSHILATRLAAWPDWTIAAATGLGVVAIDALGPDGVAPFIYFQF